MPHRKLETVRVLAIDTTSDSASIALAEEGRVLEEVAIHSPDGYAHVMFPEIERLNLGPVSTMKISWDQPHEGNMFEFLYRRRALELA